MMKTFIILIVGIVFCLAGLTNFAAPQAFHELKEQAAKGEAPAQFELGLRYYEGWGVKNDFYESINFKYLTKI
jgi:TPR repeat protein